MKLQTNYSEFFPQLKTDLLYLDTAATALKPQCVIDALTDFYSREYGTVHRAIYDLSSQATTRYQKSRETIQKFLNAKKASEIIFTKGTTEAINLIASSFGQAFITPGDEILITTLEHHSNIVPWQLMAQERQAKLTVVPIDDEGNLLNFEQYLTPRTKIVSLTALSNAIGVMPPLETLIPLIHSFGAKVFIDGAQLAPHHPVDLQTLDADFFAFSGHKTYGPTGIGVLYGKEELLNMLPPYQGGGDMIDTVSFEKTTFNTLPTKFEAGTPPIAEVIALDTAIQLLQEIRLETIHDHVLSLTTLAHSLLTTIPNLNIIGPKQPQGPIISFTIDGIHPLDLGTFLNVHHVALRTGHLCAQPLLNRLGHTSLARLSFGLYNTEEDVYRFIDHLKQVIASLR